MTSEGSIKQTEMQHINTNLPFIASLLKLHQHIYYFTVYNNLIFSSLLNCGLFSVRRSLRRHHQDIVGHYTSDLCS